MAEASDRHGELIDAALRIYRPAMRRYITDTLNGALGDDWYEKWLVEQTERSQWRKGVNRQYYEDKKHRVQTLKLDPYWLIEVSDFADIITARESHFPPEIQKLKGAMRKIARGSESRGSESRAPRQVSPILENCNAVLQAVDGDAAKQIQQLIETGEPEKPWEAKVGSLPDGPNPKDVIREVIEHYLFAMQDYMGNALHRGHERRTGSFNWFQELVLPNWPGHERRTAEKRLPDTSPKEIIDVGNIEHTIRDNPQDFPEALSDGTYKDLFVLINQARRDFTGHPARSRRGLKPRAERVAGACVTILTLCDSDQVADGIEEIRRIFSNQNEPQRVEGSVPEIADDSPPAQDISPASEVDLESDPLRGDDREEPGQEVRRREMDALSDRDPDTRDELAGAGRERERRPFFGGAFARLWASEAAQSGSAGGGGAFVTGGEVDEREPVRGRRWITVAGAILAVIFVGLAVLAILALSAESGQEGAADLPELVASTPTADPVEQARQQERPAADDQPTPNPNPEKDNPPSPPSGTESNDQSATEHSLPESAQTPSGDAGEDEPSDSGDGGQTGAGDGEQTGAGGCTGGECPTESGSASPSNAREGGTSGSGADSPAGVSGGQDETSECDLTEEDGTCPTESGSASLGNAGTGGTSNSDDGGQTGPTTKREPQLHEYLASSAPGLTTWLGDADGSSTSASALLDSLSGIVSIHLWTDGGWLRYGGDADDFTINRGHILWLSDQTKAGEEQGPPPTPALAIELSGQTEADGGQDGDAMETSDEDALGELDADSGLEGDGDAMDGGDELEGWGVDDTMEDDE